MTAKNAATVWASTKRVPPVSGGKVSAPVANLAAVAIVPLFPVTPATVNQYEIQTPRTTYETFTFETAAGMPDILSGDLVTVAGVDYVVVALGEWDRSVVGDLFIHLILEKQE